MSTDIKYDYPRIPLLDVAEELADAAGMPKPEGLRWGLRANQPDLRSRNDFRWPFPGKWTSLCGSSAIDRDNKGGCPAREGDGLCVARSWLSMASGGQSAATLLLVGWRPEHELGGDWGKVRVRRAYVRDVLSGATLLKAAGERIRSADLSYANLSSADLSSANLSSANLRSADLSSANLSSANLSSADLSSADLSYANLRYANLRSADLSYANLRSADLSSADLSYANLRYADANGNTAWPANFDPKARGVVVA